jgi:hypothetical protein
MATDLRPGSTVPAPPAGEGPELGGAAEVKAASSRHGTREVVPEGRPTIIQAGAFSPAVEESQEGPELPSMAPAASR